MKQYFKEQRAFNNPNDFYVAKAVPHLSHLRDVGDQVNRKLLEVERVSHRCALTQDALDRLRRPTVEGGQRSSALRSGDPRGMALFQALTAFTYVITHLCRRVGAAEERGDVGPQVAVAESPRQVVRRLRLKDSSIAFRKPTATPPPHTA